MITLMIASGYVGGVIGTAGSLWLIARRARRRAPNETELPATPYPLVLVWPIPLGHVVWWMLRALWRERIR